MLSKEQKEYLLPQAYNAALRAGAAILDVYTNEAELDVIIKKDNSPLTIADQKAHLIIKEYLGRTRIPLLSEEGREMLYAERKDWDLFWMVDPLDGTKEFIKGNGEFTVNIALMVNNKPEFGVVYVPYKEKIYFSDPDLGSFRIVGAVADRDANYTYEQILRHNVETLPLTDKSNSPIKIAVSRSHTTEKTLEHINIIKQDHPDAEIIEQGSSYKLCLIAEGTVDYYARTTNTYEWDTAAGESILINAGGGIRTLTGYKSLDYNKESLINPYFVCHNRWFVPQAHNSVRASGELSLAYSSEVF